MQTQLNPHFNDVLEPFGNQAAEFFLAASLYHAHKVSFGAAAALAGLSFEAFHHRLREHFDKGYIFADETILEDMETVNQLTSQLL
ncbi:hypothetical protein BGP_2694 [Beggiatoa sp. PS]|nr:hypothetical protein BGP_2694 [Beggiatoa sp. PS]